MIVARRSFAALPLLSLAAGPPAHAGAGRIEAAARGVLEGRATGAVLVARRGRVLWAGGVGDPQGRVPAPRRETVFDVLSIGKTFTSLALLRLADAGAIDLHKPIKAYLPELAEPLADIRIRQAMNNDTGLPDYLSGDDFTPRTAAEALAEIQTIKPTRKGGSGYHYANVNFQLLGLMLERAAGKPYRQIIREQVFEPAGLIATGFFSEPRWRGADVASGWVDGRATGGPASWPSNWSLLGAAGIASTVDDLYRLNRAFMAGGALSSLGRARLLLSGAPTYGRGPYIDADTIDISYGAGLYHWLDRQGRHVAFHGGDGDFGFNAVMLWRQEDDVFVCAILNSRNSDREVKRDQLVEALLGAA